MNREKEKQEKKDGLKSPAGNMKQKKKGGGKGADFFIKYQRILLEDYLVKYNSGIDSKIWEGESQKSKAGGQDNVKTAVFHKYAQTGKDKACQDIGGNVYGCIKAD